MNEVIENMPKSVLIASKFTFVLFFYFLFYGCRIEISQAFESFLKNGCWLVARETKRFNVRHGTHTLMSPHRKVQSMQGIQKLVQEQELLAKHQHVSRRLGVDHAVASNAGFG